MIQNEKTVTVKTTKMLKTTGQFNWDQKKLQQILRITSVM